VLATGGNSSGASLVDFNAGVYLAERSDPATGQSTISIRATASDDGSVAKVEFFAGTTKLREDTTAPYSFSWGPGPYSLTARATDNTGQTTTSTAVSVTVRKKGR